MDFSDPFPNLELFLPYDMDPSGTGGGIMGKVWDLFLAGVFIFFVWSIVNQFVEVSPLCPGRGGTYVATGPKPLLKSPILRGLVFGFIFGPFSNIGTTPHLGSRMKISFRRDFQ